MNTRWSWEIGIKTSETVQELWANAVDYFKWCDSNPIRPKRTVIAGKEVGKKVELELIRPYNLDELCLHCGVTMAYIKSLMQAPVDSEAYLIVGRIIINIKVQIQTLAMVGEISPILAAKVLNLDTQDEGPQKVIIEHVTDLPKLANSEIEILENVNLETGELKFKEDEKSKGKDTDTSTSVG